MSKTDKIRILGRDYRVIKKKMKATDYTLFGEILYQKHEICLNKENCREQNAETILHEVFHAISTLTGSNLSERQVTAISSAMYSVLKDNKKLLNT